MINCSDVDWTRSPSDKCSTLGYYVLFGENLVSQKSKRQNVVAWSSAEIEYHVMTLVTCELMWIK